MISVKGSEVVYSTVGLAFDSVLEAMKYCHCQTLSLAKNIIAKCIVNVTDEAKIKLCTYHVSRESLK